MCARALMMEASAGVLWERRLAGACAKTNSRPACHARGRARARERESKDPAQAHAHAGGRAAPQPPTPRSARARARTCTWCRGRCRWRAPWLPFGGCARRLMCVSKLLECLLAMWRARRASVPLERVGCWERLVIRIRVVFWNCGRARARAWRLSRLGARVRERAGKHPRLLALAPPQKSVDAAARATDSLFWSIASRRASHDARAPTWTARCGACAMAASPARSTRHSCCWSTRSSARAGWRCSKRCASVSVVCWTG